MDNSGTAKEGVGRTYTGVDGYCPLAAYLGTQGFAWSWRCARGAALVPAARSWTSSASCPWPSG